MKRLLRHAIIGILVALPFWLSHCTPQLRDAIDITTNGFVSDSHFQALIEIVPDEASRGLVARRESAYLRAKSARLNDMAFESLVNYCIDSQLKTGILEKNRKDFDLAAHRTALADKLKGTVRHGKIAFVYYNEKNAMIIGYRVFAIGFRKKVDAIITAPAAGGQESLATPARS